MSFQPNSIVVRSRQEPYPVRSRVGRTLRRGAVVCTLVLVTAVWGGSVGNGSSAEAGGTAVPAVERADDLSIGRTPEPVVAAAAPVRSASATYAVDPLRELDERIVRAVFTPSIMPTRGRLSSPFGYREDPVLGGRRFHRGLDISAPPGEPVLATADGVVTRAGRRGGLGRSVSISHGNGLVTSYSHLSALGVAEGDAVRQGEIIGRVGISGRSTGYHLHYEIFDRGRPVDPMAYLAPAPRS